MAARCLRQKGAFSEPFAPLRSVVQGLRGEATTAHVRMSQRLWLDDLSQSVTSSRQSMRRQLVSCLVGKCRSMQEAGLEVSPKSVVVRTKFQDACEIVRR
eukprot:7945440-Pyramimonas_sp.AAC.1